MKNSEIGTFLDGVAATSDLDTSGERIDIKGIDISSLPVDGLLNFEHKNDTGSQIIGKIVEAKKIMKESDCTNERHKHFWEVSRKKPFLYIIAVLFDKVGHSSASDVAAMLNFDKKIDTGETRGTGWFSIEGSRLGKEGSNITKCIARKIAFTNLPCNRSCVAELLEDPDKHCRQISKKKIEESMKKSLQEETDLFKNEGRKYFKELGAPKEPKGASYSKITPATGEFKPGKPIEPKRTFTSQTAPDKMKVGDRIVHDKKQPKGGKAFYRDLYKDLENPIRKAIMKPKKLDKSEEVVKPSKKEILKSLASEAWDSFKHKDLLIESIKKTEPELEDNEVLGIAKTYAYMDMKKKESEISDMFEKDELEKARVDEGKSKAVKQKMRQMRGSKDFAHERVKGVHQEDHSRIGSEGGESVAGNRAYRGGDIYGKKGKTKAKEEHLRVRQEASKIKPNLPKSEDLNKARVDEGKSAPQKQADRHMRNTVEMEHKRGDWQRKGTPKEPSPRAAKRIKPNLPKSEDLNKAKVDEGKSPAMKQAARAYRNKRLKIKKPDGSYKITGTPKEPKKND